MTLSVMLRAMGLKPFVNVTAEELIFGYDDTLVSLAHKFFPKHRRPLSQMGLLLGVSNFLADEYYLRKESCDRRVHLGDAVIKMILKKCCNVNSWTQLDWIQ